MTPKIEIEPAVRPFIEEAGNLARTFGFGRVIGQIYALLYFSPRSMNLAQLQGALGISKGSASTAVRQLEQWRAVRKVWVRGDRKDYYRANDWLGEVLKHAAVDLVGRKVKTCAGLMDDIAKELEARQGGGDMEFVKERFGRIRSFQKRIQEVWQDPLLQRLLKS
jgi:HTH-type transcriptional regulator, glycine betaine synthesis regulator